MAVSTETFDLKKVVPRNSASDSSIADRADRAAGPGQLRAAVLQPGDHPRLPDARNLVMMLVAYGRISSRGCNASPGNLSNAADGSG